MSQIDRSQTVADNLESQAIRSELERHHDAAFAWARCCCQGDAKEAEEVLQSTYLKILEGRARFGGAAAFKTWLFGVVRLTAVEYRRKRLLRWLRYTSDDTLEDRAGEGADPATLTEQARLLSSFRTALARLSKRQREVCHLVLAHDFTLEQAAAVLGVSLGSTRQHYERGKQRLRQQMADVEVSNESR